jgi:hypothetical protein
MYGFAGHVVGVHVGEGGTVLRKMLGWVLGNCYHLNTNITS